MSDEHGAYCAADGHVEDEDDEVSLVVETDARGREVAVMIVLQHAAVADLAVMRAWRCHQQTHRTRLELGKLFMLLLLLMRMMMMILVSVAFARRRDDAASVESSSDPLVRRLGQTLQ